MPSRDLREAQWYQQLRGTSPQTFLLPRADIYLCLIFPQTVFVHLEVNRSRRGDSKRLEAGQHDVRKHPFLLIPIVQKTSLFAEHCRCHSVRHLPVVGHRDSASASIQHVAPAVPCKDPCRDFCSDSGTAQTETAPTANGEITSRRQTMLTQRGQEGITI